VWTTRRRKTSCYQCPCTRTCGTPRSTKSSMVFFFFIFHFFFIVFSLCFWFNHTSFDVWHTSFDEEFDGLHFFCHFSFFFFHFHFFPLCFWFNHTSFDVWHTSFCIYIYIYIYIATIYCRDDDAVAALVRLFWLNSILYLYMSICTCDEHEVAALVRPFNLSPFCTYTCIPFCTYTCIHMYTTYMRWSRGCCAGPHVRPDSSLCLLFWNLTLFCTLIFLLNSNFTPWCSY